MVKTLAEPINAVRRELGYLGKAGLLKSTYEGNLKYFAVNKQFPFYTELKKIILTTIAFGDYLRGELKPLAGLEEAFIYGSVARNQESERSDIDLFLIGNIKEEKVHRVISRIEKEIGREINYTLITRRELNQRIRKQDPFIRRVLKEKKIKLKGRLDVSGKIT